ncbi:DUF58 domain-containing protein [Hydrogenimonas sp. SS33]|uniref:DUF58 domain-containing protein n=1 Tax=Hydrogenimonas leucolamina TaxID=2954236 RepID=UPI00336C24DF
MKTKVNEIIIRTRRRLFGPNIGNNISAFQGNGIDFAELKEYTYGEDVRKINWKVTAREQKPYINVFNEERELNIVVGFLMGGSIYFGSRRQKQEVMAEILALLGFSALKNSDRVTNIFYDTDVVRWFKPTKSMNTIHAALEYALDTEVLGRRSDLQGFADFLLRSIRQRSIVILLGDFYEEADLSYLGARHELYAVTVRDPFEENPAFWGETELMDPETMARFSLEASGATRAAWRKWLKAHDEKFALHCTKHRIRHTKIYTDEDPFLKLRELMK